MSNQEQALNMVLSNIRQAFTTMNNFEVFPGLSLLHLLLVLLVLHVLITLFTKLVLIDPFSEGRVERMAKKAASDKPESRKNYHNRRSD